ncbi:MAG TPA: hypothetical protein VFN05_07500 [Actinomycetes bacterium]|nr:hypothetical protein [Actinomycetes bacterium]
MLTAVVISIPTAWIVIAAIVVVVAVIALLVGRQRRQTQQVWAFDARGELSQWILAYIWQQNPSAAHHSTALAEQLQQPQHLLERAVDLLISQSYLAVYEEYTDHTRSVHLTQAGHDSLKWQAALREQLGDQQ